MEAPEKIWINPSIDLSKLNGVIDKDSVQYIRKDIVESMLATAEVHAYFTGSESEREKLALKKDAFIERACEFIDKKVNLYRYHYVGEEHECDMVDTRKFIEDFRKATEDRK